MDLIFSLTLEEIAFEGPSGCSFHRLWSLLNDRIQTEKCQKQRQGILPIEFLDADYPSLTNALKEQLWVALRSHPDVLIYVAPDFLVKAEISSNQICDSDGFDIKDRDLLRSGFDGSLDQAVDKHGSHLFIALLEGPRLRRVLFGFSTDTMSPKMLEIYAIVVRSRSKGILATTVCKLTNTDAKSLPHYISAPLRHGLIAKVNGIVTPGHVTSLLIATPFANDNEAYRQQQHLLLQPEKTITPVAEVNMSSESAADGDHLLLKSQTLTLISQILDAADARTMYAEDLLVALGMKHAKARSRFNRCLQKLESEGFIRVFLTKGTAKRVCRTLPVNKEESHTYPTPLVTPLHSPSRRAVKSSDDVDRGSLIRAITLLKPYSALGCSSESKKLVPENTLSHFSASMSLEYQIWLFIAQSGERGATAFDITDYFKVNDRLVTNCLERMLKSTKMLSRGKLKYLRRGYIPAVRKEAETAGRERRFRYYCAPLPHGARLHSALYSTSITAASQTALADREREEIVEGVINRDIVLPLDNRLVQMCNAALGKFAFKFDRRTIYNIVSTLVRRGSMHHLPEIFCKELNCSPAFIVAGPPRSLSKAEALLVKKRVRELLQPAITNESSETAKPKQRQVVEDISSIERLNEFAMRNKDQFALQSVKNPTLNPRFSLSNAAAKKLNSDGRETLGVAQKYCFETASMSRAHLFHRALSRLFADRTVVFDVALLPQMLTVKDFLSSLGVFRQSDALDRFLQTPEFEEDTQVVGDFAHSELLICNKGPARRYMLQNLNILAALGVLRPYTLHGVALDYEEATKKFGEVSLFAQFEYQPRPKLPSALSVDCNDLETVDALWRALRDKCGDYDQTALPKPLQAIAFPKSWSSKYTVLSVQELAQIDSFANLGLLYTPLHNPFLCMQIAEELGIPVHRVRARYRYLERKFRLGVSGEAGNLVSLRAQVRLALDAAAPSVDRDKDKRRFVTWTLVEDLVIMQAAIVCESSESELRTAFTSSNSSASGGIPWSKLASVLTCLSEKLPVELGVSFPSQPKRAGLAKQLPASRIYLRDALSLVPFVSLLRRWWDRVVRLPKLLRRFKHQCREYDRVHAPAFRGTMASAIQEQEILSLNVNAESVTELERRRSEARYQAEISELCRRCIIVIDCLLKSSKQGRSKEVGVGERAAQLENLDCEAEFDDDTSKVFEEQMALIPASRRTLHQLRCSGNFTENVPDKVDTKVDLFQSLEACERVYCGLGETNGDSDIARGGSLGLDTEFDAKFSDLSEHGRSGFHLGKKEALLASAFVVKPQPEGAENRREAPYVCKAIQVIRTMLKVPPERTDSQKHANIIRQFDSSTISSAMNWLRCSGYVTRRRTLQSNGAVKKDYPNLPGSRYLLTEKATKACRSSYPLHFYLPQLAENSQMETELSVLQWFSDLTLHPSVRSSLDISVSNANEIMSAQLSNVEFGYWTVEHLSVDVRNERPVGCENKAAVSDVPSVDDVVQTLSSNGSSLGLSFDSLAERLGGKCCRDYASVDLLLARLLAAGKAHAVGIEYPPLFVLQGQCADYEICTNDATKFIPRAWLTLDGEHDRDALSECMASLIETISASPGVTEAALSQQYKDALFGGDLVSLLLLLQYHRVLNTRWVFDSSSQTPVKCYLVNLALSSIELPPSALYTSLGR